MSAWLVAVVAMVWLVWLTLGKRSMLQPIERPGGWLGRRLMPEQWPNDPDDDGSNAIVGIFYALLIEAAIVGLVVLLWWWF